MNHMILVNIRELMMWSLAEIWVVLEGCLECFLGGGSDGVLGKPWARFSRQKDSELRHSILDTIFYMISNRF